MCLVVQGTVWTRSPLHGLQVILRAFEPLLAALAALLTAVDRFALGRQTRIDYFLLLGFAAIAALGYALLRPAPAHQDAPLPKGAAFRGLVPFHEADRDRFYGREVDTSALFERITHADSRFGVLYGESGCGKTSLLRAGLLPKLWDTGHVPVYCRSYKEPVATLLEACHKRFQIEPRKEEDPFDYLRCLARKLDSDLVVIYDQFEEFFAGVRPQREGESFISFVARCYKDAPLPVKFLFSIRSDFLYLIGSEFSGQIDEPLLSSRLYHLRNFDCRRAEEVIERSARAANLFFEPGLSARIARDLAVRSPPWPSLPMRKGLFLSAKRIERFFGTWAVGTERGRCSALRVYCARAG